MAQSSGPVWRLPLPVGIALAIGLPALLAVVIDAVDDPDYRLGITFIAAIAVVAVVAGPLPAWIATATGLVGFGITVVPPTGTLSMQLPAGPVAVVTFVVSAAAVVLAVHRADRAVAQSAWVERRYRRLADVGLIGVVFWHVDGRRTEANDAYLRIIGRTREDFEAGRIDWDALTAPEYRDLDRAGQAELARAGYYEPYEKEYVTPGGGRAPVLVAAALLEGSEQEGVTFVLDISERWDLARRLEALLGSERSARREAEAATRHLRVLASASSRLLAETEPDAVLRTLAEVVVPDLAPSATVLLPEGDLLRRVVTTHATRPDLADAVTRRFPITLGSDSPAAECLRTGRSIAVPASPRGHRLLRDEPEYLAAIAGMDMGDGFVVPVRAGDEVLAVLSIANARGHGPLPDGAVLAAEQVAERAGVALQRARSFAAERQLSTLMQQALLPPRSVRVEGHDVGSCYVPAATGRLVGGDWWDVLALPEGRVGLVVGDVSGHDLAAAPTMAELRHSIDGVLVHGAGPAAAATAASRLLQVRNPDSYATAFVAVYDPATRRLVHSRAGHPPPLLVVGDEVRELDEPGGSLLGLPGVDRHEHALVLPEGFELIAYTDGLVEVPGDPYDDGVARLVQAVRALPPWLPAQQRAERLVADMVGGTGRDDVCVLVLRDRSDATTAHGTGSGTAGGSAAL